MGKCIIFTILLVVIGAGSFYIGLRPFGPLASWQEQNPVAASEEVDETESGRQTESNGKNPINIQKSLSDKSEQILNIWTGVKSIRDAVNVLQSADARAVFIAVDPLKALEPFDKSLGRISGLLLFMYGFLVFEKMLLAISVSAFFLILIPICMLVTVSIIWKKRKLAGGHRIFIVSVLLCLIIVFVLPISMGLPIIIEEKALSSNINSIVYSVDENNKNAVKMDSELRGLRRVGVSIINYIAAAKEICNDAVKDALNYFIIFLAVYILLPALCIFGLYKITSYYFNIILAK